MTTSTIPAALGATALLLPIAALAQPAAAPAEDRETSGGYKAQAGVWGFDEGATAASLARDGWKFLAVSSMSWPDGRQAVVTIWQSKLGDHARCFDYFTPTMEQAGGKCERSGTGL